MNGPLTLNRGGTVDAIIFLLIFASLLAAWARRRVLALALFFAALLATMLLFGHHATDRLPLNF